MRLGFVGVGKWAQKLATAFRACGAEIVAYDRKALSEHNAAACSAYKMAREAPTAFGAYTPWRDQLADKSIDAIIAVATPEVTTEVALACAAAAKPVMATKPLFEHPERISAPFYVDFWRLWSRAHADPRTLSIDLSGHGPFRGFPGAFDWGPHVVAAVLDKYDSPEITYAKVNRRGEGERCRVDFGCGEDTVAVAFGNCSPSASGRSLWGWREGASVLAGEAKSDMIQAFCQAFLDDVAEGFVDDRLLRLSRDGMALLRKIREVAEPRT